MIGLGALFCIDLLIEGGLIPSPIINGIAEPTGGKYTDIQGGFGTLFSGLGGIFALIGKKKIDKPNYLILFFSGLVISLVCFFVAFSAVI